MGAKIRQYRERAGLTQKELAELVGVNHSAVSFWENGKAAPTTANIIKLANVLQCKPGDLFAE